MAARAVAVAGRGTRRGRPVDRMTEMGGAGERDHTPVWPLAGTSAPGAVVLGVD